jgi:BNR/Asp-box repeat
VAYNQTKIRKWTYAILLASGILLIVLCPACGSSNPPPPVQTPPPAFTLVRLSTDTFTNGDGQHATELETSTYSFGSTMVVSFEVARGLGHGGGADIGIAITTDAGTTWSSHFLSGLTVEQGGTGIATGNANVTYDAAHQVWLIQTLILTNQGTQLVVLHSADGSNWDPNPIPVATPLHPDKPWIACDNTSTSPFFGHCYIQWDTGNVGTLWFSTSTDGGLTWGPPLNPAGTPVGGNGQVHVQPNGTVVVPMGTTPPQNFLTGPFSISSVVSIDGGASWNAPVTISAAPPAHNVFNFRTGASSSGIDGAGNVYVVWPDCSFRPGCSSNDLVFSSSSDGITWSTPTRIPIDPVTSTVDHFTPGVAVDTNTSGSTAHVTVTFYSYEQANCSDATCQLDLGFVTSQDGGKTWSAAQTLAGPMFITWLPQTSGGRDVGDYSSAGYVNGKAFGAFAIAHANAGSQFDEAIYTTQEPLSQ